MRIHETAVIDRAARLGANVAIGPFCVIEPDVTIGDGCRLESHVVVKQRTALGPRNVVHEGTILGGLPQHVRRPECPGGLQIGTGNTIREHVTIHRALNDGQDTTIGDGNLLMVNVHIAHDCRIGDQTIFANNVMLAGHVSVGDRAYLSGAVGVHQFCRVGALAMVGGQAHVTQDIPPFVTVDGLTSLVVGLNLIGLRRAGFNKVQIDQLKAAYRLIYGSGLPLHRLVESLQSGYTEGPAAQFYAFLRDCRRGYVRERRAAAGRATVPHSPAAERVSHKDAA